MMAEALGIGPVSLARWLQRQQCPSLVKRSGRPCVMDAATRVKVRECYSAHFGQWGPQVLAAWCRQEGLGDRSAGTLAAVIDDLREPKEVPAAPVRYEITVSNAVWSEDGSGFLQGGRKRELLVVQDEHSRQKLNWDLVAGPARSWNVALYLKWAVDYRVLWGDPGQSKIWKQLDDILMTGTYKSERDHRMSICATCIDSGGHHTQAVYDYVKPRQSHRIFAIKGMAGFGRPIIAAPSRKRTGRNRRQVHLFTVGVDPAKGLIYTRLKLTEKGPGYCHFPLTEDFDEEFFAQLTAEKCVTRYVKGFPKREWVKTRSRNEVLDCTVYALAALYNLNPKWDALVANAEKQKGGEEPREIKPKRAPSIRRRRRKSWLNSWDD